MIGVGARSRVDGNECAHPMASPGTGTEAGTAAIGQRRGNGLATERPAAKPMTFFCKAAASSGTSPSLFFDLTRMSIDGRELIARLDIERLQQRL